jgi:hypothetical protein
MSKTIDDYKLECERLENLMFKYSKALDEKQKELSDLRMKCGFFRNGFRQNIDYRDQFIEETKEEWEPNVTYNAP